MRTLVEWVDRYALDPAGMDDELVARMLDHLRDDQVIELASVAGDAALNHYCTAFAIPPPRMTDLSTAVAEGRCGERLWLYATYHCNLACGYCLTESHPGDQNRRHSAPTRWSGWQEARELGFARSA